jgi:hypothetical protein
VVKTEVSCDRCRAVVTADRTRLAIEAGPLRGVVATDSGESAIDLCRTCAEALLAWLRPEGPVRNRPGTRAESTGNPCGIDPPV